MKKKDYDKKLFRLVHILNVINESKKASTARLSVEFNISRRTAQRDIARLIAAGFPIIEDELHKGIYSFYPGYSLKSLPVSNQEVSLLVSLCDVAHHMGEGFDQAYKNIFAKVMNSGEWDSPFFVMMPDAAKPTKNADLLKTAEEAISANKRVRIAYKNREGERKEFVMEPLKLIYYEAYWYLLLRFPGKNWLITNRLDHILTLELVDESFKPPKRLQKMLQETKSIWFNESRDKVVRIQVSAEAAPYFSERSHFPLQKIVNQKRDGSFVLETRLCHYMEAIPTILRWIPHLKVLSPKEFAQQIKQSVSEYLKALDG